MAYTLWSANTSISLGTVVAAASQILPTGLVFKCTTAGTTGGTEPAFGTDVGSTVTDGTVVWTAISSVFEDLNTFQQTLYLTVNFVIFHIYCQLMLLLEFLFLQ